MEKWLSLWSIGQEATLQDFEKIKAAGFVGVEIWAEHLRADEYLQYAKKSGLDIGIHLPFHDLNLATPDETVSERMITVNREWLKKLADAGGKHAVIHGGQSWSSEEKEESLKRVRERLTVINEFAEAHQIDLLLENLIPDKLNYCHIIASNVEEWVGLVHDTNVKACLDTGHLAVMGAPLKETIEALNTSLGSVHYSDNDHRSDLHLIPGEGEQVAKGLIDYLEAANYQGPIVYELNPYKYSLDDILAHENVKIAFTRG